MITKISGATVISQRKKFPSNVYIEDGKIIAVTTENLKYDTEINAVGKYLSPAFIDLHTHGADGYDFLDNTEEAFIKIAQAHARHGVGTILPTITSSTMDEVVDAIKVFEKVKNKSDNSANMPGLHLEGPYFSPLQAGAQDPNQIRNFNKNEYEKILSMGDHILRWTGAPELDGADDFADTLTKKGILPSIGHSDADSECVYKAFDKGFTHITHLYSCTSTVHRKNAYRYAGIVEASYLIDDMTVEIIADGAHLPKDLLQFVYRFKGPYKTALITDSVRGAGMPDGPTVVGGKDKGLDAIIEDGVAKLPDRSAFAGSVAYYDRLIRTMINIAQIPLEDAILMATETPANIMKFKNKGKISEGYDADIVIFDDNINIQRTIINGTTVYSI